MKRYENYVSALDVLAKAPEQDLGNAFVQSGVIDKFSLQFELGWKLIKRLLVYEGDPVSASSPTSGARRWHGRWRRRLGRSGLRPRPAG